MIARSSQLAACTFFTKENLRVSFVISFSGVPKILDFLPCLLVFFPQSISKGFQLLKKSNVVHLRNNLALALPLLHLCQRLFMFH